MQELAGRLDLTDDERAFDERKPHLPVNITDYFFSLIDPNDPERPAPTPGGPHPLRTDIPAL
ncbi:MAG: hypothetical protein LKE28_09105 [Sphaerochaeta sp.]|nr:hypothetical protein [Sphaerochaeta sp.]